MSNDPTGSIPSEPSYRGVVLVLVGVSALGTLLVAGFGIALSNPILLDAAVALYLSTGVLVCVARALHEREFPKLGRARKQPHRDPRRQPSVSTPSASGSTVPPGRGVVYKSRRGR